MDDAEDPIESDVASVVFEVREPSAANPKLRARLLKLLGQAVVPALGCVGSVEPVRLVGWNGGDRGRPVDELVLAQGELTLCVRLRSQSDGLAEARQTLASQLWRDGPLKPYAAQCTIDGEFVESIGAARGEEWVTVSVSERLLVFVRGTSAPLTTIAFSPRDHQELVGS